MYEQVVAKVNGKEIKQNDILRFLSEIGPELASQFQSPEGLSKVVDELVNQELLYLDALDNKLEEEAEYKRVVEETKVILLKNYAVSKLLSTEKVSQEELLEYYNNNKTRFMQEESVRASHILVESKEEAEKILKEIEEGKSFEDAAREYSSCPSREKGGDLGEFPKGQMVAEFEEAAFNMEEGTISQAVKSQFGYHIIKLVEKKPAVERDFDTVKNEVMQIVLGKKQQEVYLKRINELKGKYEVEIIQK